VALEEVLEKQLQAEEALDAFLDFSDLAMGEFSPARANGRVVAQAVEEQLDLVESETHFTGETDE
jgi:hypothetical protein